MTVPLCETGLVIVIVSNSLTLKNMFRQHSNGFDMNHKLLHKLIKPMPASMQTVRKILKTSKKKPTVILV